MHFGRSYHLYNHLSHRLFHRLYGFLHGCLLICLLTGGAARAGEDTGLYAPLPPDGSAFVRFMHVGPRPDLSVPVQINGKSYGAADALAATAYFPVKEGAVTLGAGETVLKEHLEAGGFYTAVFGSSGHFDTEKAQDHGGLLLLRDRPAEDRAKAVVGLYNLSDAPLTLRTADGQVAIFTDVPGGESRSRPINPVKLDAALHLPDGRSVPLPSLVLERGRSDAVIYAYGRAAWVRAHTDTTR